MPQFHTVIFLVSLLFIAACDRPAQLVSPIVPVDQSAYFPLSLGKYWIYQTDSIVYDFGTGGSVIRDTSRSWIKMEVTDTLRDNTGQLLFILELQEKKAANAPWQISGTGAFARNERQAIRLENNLRYLSLVFPIDQRSAWNGLLWIDSNTEIEIAGERIRPFTNWAYEADSVDVAAAVGAFLFDSTLLVTEADNTNLIEKRYSRVRYAKNVGLVWREQWILDSQYCNQTPPPPDCATLPWDMKAEKGYILQQTILAFN
ncbi:MAG: hypothetical protein SFV22_15160 [Saprospiraceae bacterium]|nr:hypothetical protein [Saprospiraceae bacterium]